MSALTEELQDLIRGLLPLYPNKQAVTLPALHAVQDARRCVSLEAIRGIAALLELSPAEVTDTMSFYGFFRAEDNPLGRTRLWVCRSLPCMLRGGEQLLERLQERLGICPGETTADGKISLEVAECVGACEGAPCVLINDEHRLDVEPGNVEGLLAELSA